MRFVIPVMLVAGALAAAGDATAQRYPGRGGGDHGRGEPRREREARETAPRPATDPVAAIERELPSLKVDLLLTREQLDAWVPFERAVRDAAEADRVRRRNTLARLEPAPSPSGSRLLAALADEDRVKAESSSLVAQRFESLYASLDEAQRRTIDRRLILSQTEPLGSERPPR